MPSPFRWSRAPSAGCSVPRAIAGLERVSRGEIRLNGVIVSTPALHLAAEQRKIGMVFQDYALFPHLSVADNIAFGLSGANGEQRGVGVAELAGTVGLGGAG